MIEIKNNTKTKNFIQYHERLKRIQGQSMLKKIQDYLDALQSRYGESWLFFLLCLFVLAVIIISFIIPLLDFGRFFGTDDYSHVYYTQGMRLSYGISDFYEKMGNLASDPSSDENSYNYPFCVWLFGSTIAKITGLSVMNGAFLLVILFFLIIIGSFYLYSDVFLELKEQKILAILFLLSMPNAVSPLLEYRPSVFTLPFLFILMYIIFKEPFQWKLLPFVWLSIFVIIISHTGTFIFLISVLGVFYLLYCLFWGKESLPVYLVILSTLVIYVFSLSWFPQIANQYVVKSTLFLTPGDFIATKFNFFLPSELGNLFYQNVIVNQQLSYAIVIGAFILVLGKLFKYVHRRILERFPPKEHIYPAITLPISNISHSIAATPIWAGPLHTILSFFGFFWLDVKGKCLFFSILIVTVLPNILFINNDVGTGALREISFLIVIIPITAALGFWQIISYLDTLKHPQKKVILFIVWMIVLLTVILTPTVLTTYYLPKISGDDYIIEGMQWLSHNGELSEKVIGYGYRTVPIYTNMTDIGYSVESGYETRTLRTLLKGIFGSSERKNVDEMRQIFGAKYIMTSNKIASNVGINANLEDFHNTSPTDNNEALNKIYSSKDYSIYDVILPAKTSATKKVLAGNITLENTGSSIKIETDVYKVILNEESPVLEQFGTPRVNSLGEGFFLDSIQISGLRQEAAINPFIPVNESTEQNTTADDFVLNNLSMVSEIQNNQIIYRTVLKDQKTGENESSIVIRYTFYPTTIKREFLVSNDWVASPIAPYMSAAVTTNMFVPLNDFIIKNEQNQLVRHVFPSQDAVKIIENVDDLYIYDVDRGIYIKNEPTAAYPSAVVYKGSTLYNFSSIRFSQTDSLKPGATLHVTQFLSPGDEVTADKNILTQERISLLNYPNGMIPIILSGYRSPDLDTGSTDLIDRGYRILLNESIPYTEVVVPEQVREIPIPLGNTTTFNPGLSTTVLNTTKVIDTVNLQSINNRNIKIIGSSYTTGVKFFKNYTAQTNDIASVIKKAQEADVPLIGYMPGALNYNLDTLKIVSDNKIPLIFSTPVNPPYYGIIGQENRNPQLARYHNGLSNVTLFPVSYPLSNSLSTDSSQTLSAWKATIDESVITDRMVLFIIRSADIGNPEYTEAIESLISYAKMQGLTFTTPDVISDHFKKIENIQYSGSVQGDTASIVMTNNNEETVRQVAFRVVMPDLGGGKYNVTKAKIVRTTMDNNNNIIYISTDISAHETKEITIIPVDPEKKMNITLPRYPIEGQIHISINDITGKPLTNAEAIIDTKYYFPDKNGDINVDLKRGIHTIRIQKPGYETYYSDLVVEGRVYGLKQFFR
jgi:hypothetical protein